MWICPICKREFVRTNQSHYCGEAAATVDEYIFRQAPDIRPRLVELRNAIRHGVPDVTERIVWSMPAFEKHGNSVSFAACKSHASFYIGENAVDCFKDKLCDFKTNKSAVYLPYSKALPAELISDIAKYCLEPLQSKDGI